MTSRAGELPDTTWRTLAERASDGLFVTDHDFRICWLNPAAEALLGYPPGALIGRRIPELFFDPAAELARLPLQRASILAGQPTITRRLFRTHAGDAVECEVAASDLGNGLVLGVARDVTLRVRAEERLERTESSFRALIESTPDGVIVHHHGVAVYANQAMARLLGAARADELIGARIIDFVHPDDRAAVIARVQRLDTGTATVPFTEERLLRRDGGIVTASIGGVNIDFDGRPCVAAIARDVTEQRKLQARLVEADRLVALGTLSAGIAHEVNNPLTYVMLHQESIASSLERLRAQVGADPIAIALVERMAQAVAVAQDGAQRVRQIVRDLRVFARADDDGRAAVDVKAALERALAIAAHELKSRVTVETEIAVVPKVLAGEGRLTQVFLNLIVNAAHAIGEGEPERQRLIVRAWSEPAPAGDGAVVKISFRDTGSGIAPEHLPRLFEPFFTTKPVGVGIGLGLSVVHGIVTGLGGAIEVASAPGAGSTFTITLPAAPA